MFTVVRSAAMIAAFATAAAAGAAVPFDVRYESEAPGIQNTTATFTVSGVETFETVPLGTGQSFSTDFGTSGAITGQYSNVQINPADQYGGAGGTGKYAVTFTSQGDYTLNLSSTIAGGVNYFGYWLSALDSGNQVSFYSKGTLLFTFDPSDVIAAVNKNANPGEYYGNPNPAFAGQDSTEPFIFLDFFSKDRPFDKIVFSEVNSGGGYESDNHTVGHYLTEGTGTGVPLSPGSFPGAVPEPASWAMMLAGFGLVGLGARRRRTAVVAA
jgi:hypothetical protein